MPHTTYVEEFEADVESAFQALWADYLTAVEGMGDRPYGYVAGDRWQQAEQYLALRDDPMAWDAQIDEWAASQGGRENAEMIAISEATRLEKLIAEMGGYDAARVAVFARRLRQIEPAMQAARRIQDMPKATLLPPLAPTTDLDLLARLTAQGEMG